MPLLGRRAGGPGLVRGIARTAAIAGTASAVSGRVQRRQQEKWAAENPEAYQQQVPAQAAPPAAEPDYTAELEKLAKLRDEGVITAEDFDAKKKQLLGI